MPVDQLHFLPKSGFSLCPSFRLSNRGVSSFQPFWATKNRVSLSKRHANARKAEV
jgi:hypothetical protein